MINILRLQSRESLANRKVISVEQILESTYYENEAKWNEIAMDLGGIEICDDATGEPIYTIGSISSWD